MGLLGCVFIWRFQHKAQRTPFMDGNHSFLGAEEGDQMKFLAGLAAIVCLTVVLFSGAWAEEFDGVEFPDGSASFADAVVSYQVGSGSVSDYAQVPEAALGAPLYHLYGNYDDNGDITYVSLGEGGTLVLKFTDNSLTTSGDDSMDLWIFEVGPAVEATLVSISKDGANWIDVGRVEGSVSGIDIDAYTQNGVVAGEFYSYVRLTDVASDRATDGADIDAVGAISSGEPVSEECFTQADVDAAYAAGMEYCQENPAACGISAGGGTGAGQCPDLGSDYDLSIYCVSFMGTQLNFNSPIILERYTNPDDVFGFYWTLP